MPNATESLKAALDLSVKDNSVQVAITEESRVLLASMLREEMAAAVSEGIRLAMTKQAAEIFANVFMDQMRVQANTKVNAWAGDLMRQAFKKVTFFIIVGSVVYSAGGWTALAVFGKWVSNEVFGIK